MSLATAIVQPELDGATVLYGTAVLFVVSVLSGGVGNYLGIRLVSDQHPTYVHAVVSSILSAAVWAAVSYALAVYDPGITPWADRSLPSSSGSSCCTSGTTAVS